MTKKKITTIKQAQFMVMLRYRWHCTDYNAPSFITYKQVGDVFSVSATTARHFIKTGIAVNRIQAKVAIDPANQ